MGTTRTRVTRSQAAELAGVSVGRIRTWERHGFLTVRHAKGPGPTGRVATYRPEEVLRVAAEQPDPGAGNGSAPAPVPMPAGRFVLVPEEQWSAMKAALETRDVQDRIADARDRLEQLLTRVRETRAIDAEDGVIRLAVAG